MTLASKASLAVAHWPLNEASGNALDSIGSVHLTDNNTVGSNTGKFGTAREFVAANSEYFSVSDNATVSMGDIDFMFRCWFKAASLSGGPRIFSKWGSFGNFEYQLFVQSSNVLRWVVSADGTNQDVVVVDASNFGVLSTDTWYLVHVWHDASANQIGIAVNGVTNTASHTGGVYDGSASFWVGQLASQYWTGLIEDLVLLKGGFLDSTERTADYNGGVGTPFSKWIQEGSGIASAVAGAQAQGYTVAAGEGTAPVIADASGVGYATAQGSATCAVIVDATATGYHAAEGSGECEAVSEAQAQGYASASGIGTAEAVAAAQGVGYHAAQGSGEATAEATAIATGYHQAVGSGECPVVAGAGGTGYIVASGSGTAEAIANAFGVGFAEAAGTGGSGVASAVANAVAQGYAAAAGSGEAEAIANALATGYAIAAGSGIAEAVATAVGVSSVTTEHGSLEAAIHARWPDKTPLATVLPWESVFTGIAPPDATMPYCSLTRTSNPVARRTNTGDVEDVQIRMEVFSDSFDAGRLAIETLKLAATQGGWNRDAFRIDQYSAAKAMIYENDYYNQDDDGVWRFVVDWLVKVESLLAGQVFVSTVGVTDAAGELSNLEAAVHARWGTKAALEQTLPIASVFTGIAPPDTALPFASITRTSSPMDRRANRGDVEDIQLRIQVFSDSFDEGRGVVEALKRPTGRGGFNRDSFNIDDRKAVAAMLLDNEFYIQEPDGVWQFTVDFNVKLEALLATRN